MQVRLLVVFYAAVGVVYFVTTLGWSFATAFYAVVQILTTVGYGDLPFDDAKGFVTIYVLAGLAIVANIMNDIFNEVLNYADDEFSKHMHQARDFLYTFTSDSESDAPQSKRARGKRRHVRAPTESRRSKAVKLINAVITFATVGFGDYSPKTQLGRVLGGFMMVFGVLAFATLVGSIASLLDAFKDSYKKKTRVSPEVFRTIDLNGSGFLSKAEFRSYMLLRQGKVSKDLLATIDRLYDSIDSNKNGQLSFKEIDAAERHAALFVEED
eukprot:Skav225705  [mRNA]  locus=scaffold919:105676:111978:- [translate_table: standard]